MSDVIREMVDPSEALELYDAGEISEDELEELAPGVFDLAEDEEDDDANVDPEEDE